MQTHHPYAMSEHLSLNLKIEPHAGTHLPRFESARGDEERVEEGAALLFGGGGAEGVEVDELGAEGEDGFVQSLYKTHSK